METNRRSIHVDGLNRESVDALHRALERLALRGRRELLGLPLRPHQVRRLDELNVALVPPPTPDASGRQAADFLRRQEARCEVVLPVELRDAAGERHDGRVLNLSASGLYVAGSGLPRTRGERVGLRFVDEHTGREWHFVGEVMWACVGAPSGAGLRFVGIPVELRLGVRGGAPPDRVPVAA